MAAGSYEYIQYYAVFGLDLLEAPFGANLDDIAGYSDITFRVSTIRPMIKPVVPLNSEDFIYTLRAVFHLPHRPTCIGVVISSWHSRELE